MSPDPAPSPFAHSRTRIDRAAALLRTSIGEQRPFDAEIEEAVAIVDAFRLAHTEPLGATIRTLRELAAHEGAPRAAIAHRVKRLPQVLTKLSRRPTLRLSTLNDVAGCRVVAPLPLLEALFADLHEHAEVRHVDDYRAEAKPSGYRAVHVVLTVDRRRVEVQLRTPTENSWAAWIEDLDRRPHLYGIKDGRGPEDALELVALVSRDLAEGTLAADDFHRYRHELEEMIQ